MTDLITGQRTFCLGLSGLGSDGVTETIDVPFVDTAGNLIKCNYFKLQATDPGAGTNKHGAVIAELSGVSHDGNAVLNEVSALNAAAPTSGICGIGVVTTYLAISEAEWHGSNGEVSTGVKLITQGTTPNIAIMITYGNLYPLNVNRLEQSYDAGS